MDFTKAEAEKWAAGLENSDGTTGPHWPIEQTSALADSMGISPEQVPPWCWWITVNMMYADYSEVALHYGIKTVGFLARWRKHFCLTKTVLVFGTSWLPTISVSSKRESRADCVRNCVHTSPYNRFYPALTAS